MEYINLKIRGVPYSKAKSRGKLAGPAEWSSAIIEQTRELQPVRDACILRITFLLPPDKYPTDLPHGPDLDNLLKRSLDALGHTIFKAAQGGDSCVVSLVASKTRVDAIDEAGIWLEVMPVSTPARHASGVASG